MVGVGGGVPLVVEMYGSWGREAHISTHHIVHIDLVACSLLCLKAKDGRQVLVLTSLLTWVGEDW